MNQRIVPFVWWKSIRTGEQFVHSCHTSRRQKGRKRRKSGSCHKRSLGDRSEFDWGTRFVIRILIPRTRALSKSMGKRFKEIVKTSLKIRTKVHYRICLKKSGAFFAKLLWNQNWVIHHHPQKSYNYIHVKGEYFLQCEFQCSSF